MYGLLDYDKHLDELSKWEQEPYYQVAARLDEVVRTTESLRRFPLGQPAFPFGAYAVPAVGRIVLIRERLERQFAALRCVEAIRLYAAEHGGKLPVTLAGIKEVPLPVCPVTGQPFTYRLRGETALLSAPEVPAQARRVIQPLAYEITIRH
jgi:hypothetical protein